MWGEDKDFNLHRQFKNILPILRDKAEILGIFFCFPFYVHKLISPMDNFSFLVSDS